MPSFHRLWWRAAADIAAVLQERHHRLPPTWQPVVAWSEIDRLRSKLDLCQLHDWHAAVREMRQRLSQRLGWLQTDMAAYVRRLDAESDSELEPTASGVYQELIELQQEFDGVTVDRTAKTVTVMTDSIELDDLYLGPFAVVWNWARIGHSDKLRILAQEPNRPELRTDVTHPHVMDDHLCEGDAQRPLQQALRDGRLCDYFRIVIQVLESYNPSSAYVAIEDWTSAARCAGCDVAMVEDALWICDRCGDALCEECTVRCTACGRAGCRSCCTVCGRCNQHFCQNCLTPDDRVTEQVCRDCQHEETESESHQAASEPTAPATAATHIAVHPDGVGQVAVPAGSR